MVMHSQSAEILQSILKEMEAAIARIEAIIPLEQEAINQLNAEELHKLMEKRKLIWLELKDCKSQCQLMFIQYDMPEESDLSLFVDTHLTEDAVALHKQREELNQRIVCISEKNELNAIRLRAASEAISETLQGIGLLKVKTTYGRDGMM